MRETRAIGITTITHKPPQQKLTHTRLNIGFKARWEGDFRNMLYNIRIFLCCKPPFCDIRLCRHKKKRRYALALRHFKHMKQIYTSIFLHCCYFVTLSSHFTIPSITPIETAHTARNTPQHSQIGHLLYINGPTQRKRLPRAVAPSHKPWQSP